MCRKEESIKDAGVALVVATIAFIASVVVS